MQSRDVSSRPCHHIGREYLEEGNRHVAEGERLVAGWIDLIDQRQAEGKDGSVARDLLDTFLCNQ
jgi:hypothetical protein